MPNNDTSIINWKNTIFHGEIRLKNTYNYKKKWLFKHKMGNIFSFPPLDFYSGRGGGEKKNLGHFEDPRKITLPPRKFPRSSPVFS